MLQVYQPWKEPAPWKHEALLKSVGSFSQQKKKLVRLSEIQYRYQAHMQTQKKYLRYDFLVHDKAFA